MRLQPAMTWRAVSHTPLDAMEKAAPLCGPDGSAETLITERGAKVDAEGRSRPSSLDRGGGAGGASAFSRRLRAAASSAATTAA